MNTIIVAPVRLLGEGLASSLSRRPDLNVQRVLPDLASLRAALRVALASPRAPDDSFAALPTAASFVLDAVPAWRLEQP